jgi:hypothetical protein
MKAMSSLKDSKDGTIAGSTVVPRPSSIRPVSLGDDEKIPDIEEEDTDEVFSSNGIAMACSNNQSRKPFVSNPRRISTASVPPPSNTTSPFLRATVCPSYT